MIFIVTRDKDTWWTLVDPGLDGWGKFQPQEGRRVGPEAGKCHIATRMLQVQFFTQADHSRVKGPVTVCTFTVINIILSLEILPVYNYS